MTEARAEGRLKEVRVDPSAFAPSLTNGVNVPLDALSEAEFQTKVCDFARSLGWKVAHFRKVRVQRKDGSVYWETPVAEDGKGFLDLFFARRGYYNFHAELKVKDNTPTPEQWEWVHTIRESGGVAFVWYPSDWTDIVEALTQARFLLPTHKSLELHRLADDGNPHSGDDEG